jgi:hypothetical protein
MVQGKTQQNQTTLVLNANTVFGISTDLESKGRVGDNFKTNGDPPIITIDWTNRMFSLTGTIKNQQQSASVKLSVNGALANQPPRANAGLDQLLECTSANGTPLKLSGSNSTDPDGQNDIAAYAWDWSIGNVKSSAAGIDLSLDVPLGTFTFGLTVRDKAGAAESDSVSVKSHDTTSPTLTLAAAAPSCIWPPNHRYVLFELGKDLGFTVSDACDTSPKVEIIDVKSSQPMSKPPDFAFGGAGLCLQAQRAGGLGDRVYTISIRATDHSNNSTIKKVTVRVPHDQSNVSSTRIVDITDPRCTEN